ncbi:MAG: Lrp/AsnC family transcriptional regulator [Elioraea sp.]|nr:Lrp/AsnC family transcriptional regulator [Elioraea sp.]
MPVVLDGFDLRLLDAAQADGRASHVALAERVGLSASQCARRLARLEQAGVIRGWRAVLDEKAVGLGVTALVFVRLERHDEGRAAAFHRALAAMPEVTEALLLTGDADYLLRVLVPDLEAFAAFALKRLMPLPGVASIRSSIVLETVKRAGSLPLPKG